VDVKAVAPVLNYINLMTYDMAYGTQYFNSNLYDSSHWPTVAAADKYSADFVVNNYLAAGLKPSQMNLGIGFYGRVPKRAVEPGIDWTKADAQNNPVTQPYFGPQQIALFASLGYDLSKDTYVKYNDIVGKLLNDPQNVLPSTGTMRRRFRGCRCSPRRASRCSPSPMRTRAR
jgi:chitinase